MSANYYSTMRAGARRLAHWMAGLTGFVAAAVYAALFMAVTIGALALMGAGVEAAASWLAP